MTLPVDDEYDYAAVTLDEIRAGDDILRVVQSAGEVVISADEPNEFGEWYYTLSPPEGGVADARIPEDPESLPPHWWSRPAAWIRVPLLDAGATWAAPDGSRWIQQPTGDLIAIEAGSEFQRSAVSTRREILSGDGPASPRLLSLDAAEGFDWLPRVGGDIVLGDFLISTQSDTAVIDHVEDFIVPADEYFPADTRVIWVYGPGPSDLFEWTTPDWVLRPPAQYFRRTPKPTADQKFRAADGSLWIFTAGAYYCWVRGTKYAPGAIFQRGEIAGGLREIG